MKVILQFTLLLCFELTALATQCQDNKNTTKQLPVLKDWFLSTGDWQNAPQLYVKEFGSGSDTVVMLHGGWGGNHDELVDAVTGLEKKYHFIFYEQRGSLRSPFPDSLISFYAHIEDLELLRKELGLDKLILAGHSMGGVLASAYASKYPQRIERLILLAPAYLKNPIPPEEETILKSTYPGLEKFVNRPEISRELASFSLNRAGPLSSKEETAKYRIQTFSRMIYDIQKWKLLTGGRALFKGKVFGLTANSYPEEGWNYIEDLKKATYPVRIITGDHDFLDFGNLLYKKWMEELPQAKFTVIKNAGHIIWIDQPARFIQLLELNLKN